MMLRPLKLRKGFYALIGVLLLCQTVTATTGDEALWLTALDKYRSGRYRSASIDLQGVIQSGWSNYESAARLLLGKCYLHQKKLDYAEDAARNLIRLFPHSRYAPHARYLLAQVAYLRKDYMDSAWQLLTAIQAAHDEDLRTLGREKLAGIFESYLDDEQQSQLLRWVESPQVLAELQLVQQGYKTPAKVGIILELSGPNGASGAAVLLGIEAAYQAGREKIAHDLALSVRDSGGRVIAAVRAAQELISEEEVIALIGGLQGPCSAAIAAIAAENGVPLILPAAQDIGLTDIGTNVFQLLVDYFQEGWIMADFARSDLEAERVAVLAPASEAGNQRAEGFRARFEELGGEVVSVQWYYREATTYKRQLDDLTRIGAIRLGEEYELTEEEVEELIAWDKEPEAEDLEKVEEGEQSEERNPALDELLEEYVSPMNYFDALYIPLQGEEISLLAPQIAASGFSRYLIGDADCLDHIAGETNRRYTNRMIFPASFSSPVDRMANSDFSEVFYARTGRQPDHWSLLGWDAFNFLASALREPGRPSSKRIIERLQQVRRFEGERLDMAFPEGERSNHAMFILSYVDGEFTPLKTPRQVAKPFLQ